MAAISAVLSVDIVEVESWRICAGLNEEIIELAIDTPLTFAESTRNIPDRRLTG